MIKRTLDYIKHSIFITTLLNARICTDKRFFIKNGDRHARLLVISFFVLVFTSISYAGSFNQDVSSTLLSMSKEINKNLPVRIDSEKTLETTVTIKNVLIFKYKITDDSNFRNPRFNINKYTYHLRNSLGESTCKDKETFSLLKRGASYNYIFINRYGQKLVDFTLDEKECSNYLSGAK